jgi:hypothetical protein
MLKDMKQSREMFPETENLSKQSTSSAGAQQSWNNGVVAPKVVEDVQINKICPG